MDREEGRPRRVRFGDATRRAGTHPSDAVGESELEVRAGIAQIGGASEMFHGQRLVRLDPLAHLVRAPEERHRLAVVRVERERLAEPAHRARVAPVSGGELREDVARGAKFLLRGTDALRRPSLDRGCGLAVVGKTRVIHQQAFLAELVLRRFPRVCRRARPGSDRDRDEHHHQRRNAPRARARARHRPGSRATANPRSARHFTWSTGMTTTFYRTNVLGTAERREKIPYTRVFDLHQMGP